MKRAFWAWLSWFVFLFVVDFVIPFLFLGEVKLVTGSFLFWTVWILVAIISMFIIVSRWRDSEQ
jgi:uncharacterized membrane protein YhaH (DUF805 family)